MRAQSRGIFVVLGLITTAHLAEGVDVPELGDTYREFKDLQLVKTDGSKVGIGGYFSLAKVVDSENVSHFTFLSPNKRAYFPIGFNHVSQFLTRAEERRPFLEFLKGGPLTEVESEDTPFDTPLAEDAGVKIVEMLLDSGCTASDSFPINVPTGVVNGEELEFISPGEIIRGLPHTVTIKQLPVSVYRIYENGPGGGRSVPSGFNRKTDIDVFDPDTRGALSGFYESKLRNLWGIGGGGQRAAIVKNVIGVLSVDEPTWGLTRVEFFKNLPDGNAGRDAYDQAMSKGGSLKKREEDFLGEVADLFFQSIREGIERVDPKLLYMGDRFTLRAGSRIPRQVFQAAGRHCDVITVQPTYKSKRGYALNSNVLLDRETVEFNPGSTYDRDSNKNRQFGVKDIHRLSKRPIVIADWVSPYSGIDDDVTVNAAGGVQDIPSLTNAKNETRDWIDAMIAEPYVIGLFRCTMIGEHETDAKDINTAGSGLAVRRGVYENDGGDAVQVLDGRRVNRKAYSRNQHNSALSTRRVALEGALENRKRIVLLD